VGTGTRLEAILQLIDTKLCGADGESPYSNYNTYCLLTGEDESPATQQEFVETISEYVCNTQTQLNTFVNSTYAGNYASQNTRITNVEKPVGLHSNSYITIPEAATQTQMLQLHTDKLADLNTRTSLNGVTWNSCYTVDPLPTSIAQGFNTVLTQICTLRNQVSGAGDTYKIKTRNTDTNPDYLYNKFKSTASVAFYTMTETNGVEKIFAEIPTMEKHIFDMNQFDINQVSADATSVTKLVSIKPSAFPTPENTVDCTSVMGVYSNYTTGALPGVLVGSNAETGECQRFEIPAIKNAMFTGYTTGDYVIMYDADATVESAKIQLKTYTPVTNTDTNIYNSDGTVSGNRVITGDPANTIRFAGFNDFTIGADVDFNAGGQGYIGGFGMAINVVPKTSDYSATKNDSTIVVDTTGGNVMITLPTTGITGGKIFIIKKIAASNNVIIDVTGEATIDGASTKTITTQWDLLRLQFNGTGYYII
jgi:hypothetical protein